MVPHVNISERLTNYIRIEYWNGIDLLKKPLHLFLNHFVMIPYYLDVSQLFLP